MNILAVSVLIGWDTHSVVQFPSHQIIQIRQASASEFLFSPCTPKHLYSGTRRACPSGYRLRMPVVFWTPVHLIPCSRERASMLHFPLYLENTRKSAYLEKETLQKLSFINGISFGCLSSLHLAFKGLTICGSCESEFKALNCFIWAKMSTSEECLLSKSHLCHSSTTTAKSVS